MAKGVARLTIGETAPDFRLPSTGAQAGRGKGKGEFALADYRGRKNVVLAFFPAAFTPV